MWLKSKPTPPPERLKPSRVTRLWSDSLGSTATRALQTIIVLILLIAIFFGLRAISLVAIPVLLALILASAFAPIMQWFRRRKMPSALATVIVLLLIALTFTGVVWLIVWTVQDQFDELAQKAQQGFEEVLSWVQGLPFAPTEAQLQEWQDNIVDFLTSASFGSGALAGVSAVTSFFTGLVLLIVILFFFLKDGPKIWQFVIRPFRGADRERVLRAGEQTVTTLGLYVRGTAAVAAVDAIGIGVGLWIFQVPLALPLAVLVFFLSFIPLVGATLAGILAALVALVSNGLLNAVAIVAVVVIVNQLEGNFLQPFLMGRALRLHALVILMALSIGTVVGGILGAVLSVPITAVVWAVIKVWDGPDLPARWARKHETET